MKLHEIATVKPFISDEAADWLAKIHEQGMIGNYFIQRDGTIDVDGTVDLSRVAPLSSLPVQFGVIKDNCYATGSSLTSLRGLPHKVGRNFYCPSVKSLSGINKIVKFVGKAFITDSDFVPTHTLGVLLIAGIQKIIIDRGPIDEIMNKYLKTHDVISAQDALIDAGFIEQAKL